MKRLCFLLIILCFSVAYLKPFNITFPTQCVKISVQSLADFSKFEVELLRIIEQYKEAVLIRIEKREQFLKENENNTDLIDFLNFLVSEGIIQPNMSIGIGKINKNRSWSDHPELIDQITTFFNTGTLPVGEDPKSLHSLYGRILGFITEGPLKTPFKSIHLPNCSNLLENIKLYQRALVSKIGEKILHVSSAVQKVVHTLEDTRASVSREAQMFSTVMAFFYLWSEKPEDIELEKDFIKFANMYYREHSSHFEKIRSYLREKIKPVVIAKLNTSDMSRVLKESHRIEQKITKRGWWQFWK